MRTRLIVPLALALTGAWTSTVCAQDDDQIAEAIRLGAEAIIDRQEGPDDAEWPYEGVYRVRGKIPIGYRVGGTGICGMALLASPVADETQTREALARATRFVIDSVGHELMNPVFESGYDVRGWGYTYGLMYLLELKERDAVPEGMGSDADRAIGFYVNAIEATEFERGGWNYARRGFRPSPFMTAPTLQVLFKASEMGIEVDRAIIDRALDALERGRTKTGSVVYSGDNGAASNESVPGSVGRMLSVESTLLLAGRGSTADVRSAIDAFIVHWEWLEKRRAQDGTHVPPYGIAPYYFYFAHYYAAYAIELLPEHERGEYRRRLHGLIDQTRSEDGLWNDRVFDRSAAYGTAMIMLALAMPERDTPPGWAPAEDGVEAGSD